MQDGTIAVYREFFWAHVSVDQKNCRVVFAFQGDVAFSQPHRELTKQLTVIRSSLAVAGSMLSQTFSALADPTRRAIVALLANGDGLTVSALAEPFPVSLPAVIKHIDVLCGAGLVTRERTGRTVTCRLRVEPMSEAMAWLDRHVRFWDARLDALADLVEATPSEATPRHQTKETKSNDDQKRARRRRR